MKARRPRKGQQAGRDGRRGKNRAVRAAERRGRAKAKVIEDLVQYAIVCGVLAIFVPGAARWVALIWGFFLAGDLIKKIIEPELRRRWIDREVRRELDMEVAMERQRTEDEHARHIEHLAAGVAHEIRNPITAAKSLVQQMGEDPSSRENIQYADVALEELGRVERSISHLLRFAREEGLRPEALHLEDLVYSALETFRDRLEQEDVDLRLRLADDGELEGDPEKLRRVAINLIGNGLDAMRGAGTARPVLEIDSGHNLARTEVWLRVRDHGPGIDGARADQIWSPFYTSKDEGTGLGLALTKKIIEAHGGTIEAGTDPGGGAAFVVTLPTTQPRGPRREAAQLEDSR